MESERNSETVEQFEEKGSDMDSGNIIIQKRENSIRNEKKKKKKSLCVSKSGCFRSDLGHPTVEESDIHGNFDMESASNYAKDREPTHLVVTVNGIIGRLVHSPLPLNFIYILFEIA